MNPLWIILVVSVYVAACAWHGRLLSAGHRQDGILRKSHAQHLKDKGDKK